MTQDEIILRHRINLLLRAKSIKNISKACRQYGVSRTVYYKYQDRYITYGIEGLKDKEKSAPVMPNATKANVVDKVLEYCQEISYIRALKGLQMNWGILYVLPLYTIS